MNICPVGAELFHVDVQTGRLDEANGRFSLLQTHLKRTGNRMGGYEADSSGSG